MTLTTRLCSELIRQRLNLPDDSQAAKIVNLIPQALKATGRKIAADPNMRQLLMTDKLATSIPIGTHGAVNLVTGYDTWQFLLEYFDQGLCYHLIDTTFDPADVSVIGDTIDIGVTDFVDLDAVRFTTTGALPTGISLATTYYIISYSNADPLATLQLSPTADGSGLVNITGQGTGVHTMQKYLPTTELPMQRLKNPQQAQLDRYLSSVFTYYTVQADTLFIFPTTLTGQVNFANPCYPTNLAALPDSEEAEKLFLQELTNLVAVPTPV